MVRVGLQRTCRGAQSWQSWACNVCSAPRAGRRGHRGTGPQCWATHIPPATTPWLAGCFVPTVSLQDAERRSRNWGLRRAGTKPAGQGERGCEGEVCVQGCASSELGRRVSCPPPPKAALLVHLPKVS